MRKKRISYSESGICPVCGISFVPAPMHVCKDRRGYGKTNVCSWKCVCESERLLEEQKKLRREKFNERKRLSAANKKARQID